MNYLTNCLRWGFSIHCIICVGILFICIGGDLHPHFASASEFDELISQATKHHCHKEASLEFPQFNANCFVSLVEVLFGQFEQCSSDDICFMCTEDGRKQVATAWFNTEKSKSNSTFTIHNFRHLSVNLFVWLHEFHEVCQEKPFPTNATDDTPEYYIDHILDDKHFQDEELDHWLDDVYTGLAKFINPMKVVKCESSSELYKESEVTSTMNQTIAIKTLAYVSVAHLMNGFKLAPTCDNLPFPTDIVNGLYLWMNVTPNTYVPEIALHKIMTQLGIGNDSSNSSTSTEDAHSGHQHRKKRSAESHSLTLLNRKRRDVNSISERSIQCLSIDDYFTIYKANDSVGISPLLLKEIALAFIQQTVSGVCNKTATVPSATKETTPQMWGYGTLAVLIITLLSLVGIFAIPCTSKTAYPYVMMTLIGLGVGTLFADAILHLLPDIMGLHEHSDDGEIHQMESTHFFYKSIVVLFSLYLMFVMEVLLNYFVTKRQKATNFEESQQTGSTNVCESHSHIQDLTEYKKTDIASTSSPTTVEIVDSSPSSSVIENAPKTTLALALMVIIGDAIHNFADGLAIGAAFTASPTQGLSTSIAIFCHELPHEFADFAVLLSSGFSVKKALLCNLLSALSAFVGLWIAIPLSVNDEVRRWIFSVTSGIFLYVALTDMLPTLKDQRTKSPLLAFAVQNIGIVSGFIIMILLGVYEESIQIY